MTGLSGAGWRRAIAWLGIAALAILTSFHAPLAEQLADPFHEGEYLSTRLLFGPGTAPPLLIHGYMDYAPARMAQWLFGPDRVVAGTRLLNMALGTLAAFAFFGCLLQLPRNRSERLGAVLFGSAVLVGINARMGSVVALHQGSPAVRDVLLLAEVWCLLVAARGERNAGLFAGVAGLIAGLGLFWAYNRGIAGVLALPAYGLATAYAGRGWRQTGWLAAGFAVGAVVCFAAEPVMWPRHMANILYWQRHGAIWHKPFGPFEIAQNLPFFLLGVAVLATGCHALWRCRHDPARAVRVVRLAVLLVVAGLAYQSSFNRADAVHLNFAVPALTLLAFAIWGALAPEPQQGDRRDGRRAMLRANAPFAAILAGLLLIGTVPGRSGFLVLALDGTRDNILALLHGLPRDTAITEPRLLAVARALRQGGGRCTYVFDNSGALYHLSGLPACSSVMLPVYAADEAEAWVIAQLADARPPLVVGRSDLWSDAIDRRGLADRTPALHQWLLANYHRERTIEGIELWRVRATAPAPTR